ncbi:MAG: hypothetical protein RI907_1127 [Pseudomonadota bacterium]|jgi:hypothetical protein
MVVATVDNLGIYVFLQHFWLLCGLWCGVVNSLFIWRRLQPHVSQGAFTRNEVNTFTVAMGSSVLLPMLVLWVLQQQAAQAPSPVFLTWSNPQKFQALGLQVALWCGLLYFVFLRNGAQVLSRFIGVGYKGWVYTLFFSPQSFRWMAIGTVVSGVATAAFNLMA